MIDVACVAQVMWDDVLSSWARQRIASRLGLSAQEDAAGRWIAFWAVSMIWARLLQHFNSVSNHQCDHLHTATYAGLRCPVLKGKQATGLTGITISA